MCAMKILRVFFLFSLASLACSQCTPSLHFVNPRTGNDFLTVSNAAEVSITSLLTPFGIRAEFCVPDIQSVSFSFLESDKLNAELEIGDRLDNDEPYTSDIITSGAVSRIRDGLNSGVPQFFIVKAFDRFKAAGNIVDSLGIEFVLTSKTRITPLPSPTPSTSPVQPSAPFVSVSLLSPSSSTFNAPSPLVFEVSGTTFQEPLNGRFVVTIDGFIVPNSQLSLTPTRLTVRADALFFSRSEVILNAPVESGGIVTFSTVVFFGTDSLIVDIVDAEGNPFLIPTTITAKLSDDLSIQAVVNTDTGTATFDNVPDRTILVEAISETNDIGIAVPLGSAERVSIEMIRFSDPSSIDNNDFSRGLAGWFVPNRMVTAIIPHVEEVGPDADPEPSPDDGFPDDGFPFESPDPDQEGIVRQVEDRDLELSTEDIVIQNVSRTFEASFGTTGVRVRYRFVTSEVLAGFFPGSLFNDFFAISIRSLIANDIMTELSSIFGLGPTAFSTFTGSTAYRELILPLDEDFDTVEVRLSVGNIGDELFDSQVILDFVEELGCNLGEAIDVPSIETDILERAQELANEGNEVAKGTGLPGARNGSLDAFRQCFWSCRMTQEFGPRQARLVGDLHEICGGNPEEERLMDLRNNEVGRSLGRPAGDCRSSCLEGISDGELQISL